MRAKVPPDMPEGTYRVLVKTETGEFVDVELVVAPPFPLIPAFAVLGGVGIALVVATSAWRRRGGKAMSAVG